MVGVGEAALGGDRQLQQPFKARDVVAQPPHAAAVARFQAGGGVEVAAPGGAIPKGALVRRNLAWIAHAGRSLARAHQFGFEILQDLATECDAKQERLPAEARAAEWWEWPLLAMRVESHGARR